MRIKKEYYIFKEKDGDYYWEGPHREKLRFCGRPKFIIQSLVNLYGPEMAKEIFDKFMEGVKKTPNIDVDGTTFKAATFVLYSRDNKDEIKEFGGKHQENVYDQEEKYGSYGENTLTQNLG